MYASQRNHVMWQLLGTRQSFNAKTEMLGWPICLLLTYGNKKTQRTIYVIPAYFNKKTQRPFGKYLGAAQCNALSNCNSTKLQDPKSNIC